MNSKKILFISHDANRAGGQIFLLSIMQYFKQKGQLMHLLLLDDGSLENDFRAVCQVTRYPKLSDFGTDGLKNKLLKKVGISREAKLAAAEKQIETFLLNEHFDLIYVNTIASAWVMPKLDYLKIPILTHIHELEFSLQMYSTLEDRNYLFSRTNKLIACSQAVGENLVEKHDFSVNKIATIHSFIDNIGIQKTIQNTDNQQIKEKYKLPKNSFLIGGCGNAEWRKGLDIFILVVRKSVELNPNLHFVWIGIPPSGELYDKMIYDIEKLNISKNLTLIAPTPEAVEILNCLDVFSLVSREDPFPLVMLEAALAQKPIVGFAKTGGCPEFVEDDAGFVVPYLAIDEMAKKINELANNPLLAEKFGKQAQYKVLNKFNFETSIEKIQKEVDSID